MTETLFIEPVNMCNTFHYVTTKVKHWLNKQILLLRVNITITWKQIIDKYKITQMSN